MPALRPFIAFLLAVGALVVLAGCGGDDDPPATETTAQTACRRPVAEPAPRQRPQRRPKPTETLSTTRPWRAIVSTNCGEFTITLDVEASPKTTASFVALARDRFYDGLTFHRIAPGFVIQGGDPLGNGLGGPGYTVVEPPPSSTRYLHGTVAMAKTATDPDGTSGSQFFIVTGEDAQLPPQYALLGQVTDGLPVVDRIDALPLRDSDPQGSPPADPVVIERVTIRQG